MKLNGWQRIGVIASALWAVGGAIVMGLGAYGVYKWVKK